LTETEEEFDLLGVLDFEAPDVVRLAEMVSIASRIEPFLLRRARLQLCRGMEAGVELELWHSDLVQAHSPRAMTLHPPLAHVLQARLCQSRKLDEAYDLLKECHHDLPEAIRLEEEMTWRILRGELASERVKRLLRRATASLVEGGQAELAHWASRFLTRAPKDIRELPDAWVLSLAASSRLGGARVLPAGEAPPGLQADELHWAIANSDQACTLYVGVQNDRVLLSLAAPGESTQPAHPIAIPLTDPIIVEVDDGQAPGPHLYQLDHTGKQVLELPVTGRPLKLTTVAGDVYEISVPVVPAASDSIDASSEPESQTGIFFEALDALSGDCLLLRYPGPDGKERLWIIDGGPRRDSEEAIIVWHSVLLPRLREINPGPSIPVALGMVSSADVDHIHGMQGLIGTARDARPGDPDPAPVKFSRFWFNSLDSLLGPRPTNAAGEAATASLQSLVDPVMLGVGDELAPAIIEGVQAGNALASDLAVLGLSGNSPINGVVSAKTGQQKYNIEGAVVTILGPRQDRLDALREEWAKALSIPARPQRQAALQMLFQSASHQDRSIPNLSSIVVLVEVGGRKLLLTGNAHGDDVITAWMELGLGTGPVAIDVLKMPNHGSIRNCTERFITFFNAEHYVFSGKGTHDFPDAATVEAVVKFHGARKAMLHFTNHDVAWSQSHTLEKGGKKVDNLTELLAALHAAYGGPWTENFRAQDEKSVMVAL
jgi:hypothetical protein